MSVSFESQVKIAAPPERVFAALADLDHWHLWMPDLVAVERLTPGAGLTPGTSFKETRRVFGKEASEIFEVAASDPPRALELRVDGTRGSSKRGQYRFDYRLVPEGTSGTRVELAGRVDGLGLFYRLLGRLFVGMLRKGCDRDLHALASHLERAA